MNSSVVTKAAMKKRINTNSTWHRIWMNKGCYAMMAPFAAFFLIFTALPVLISIVLSFTYFDIVQAPYFIGLKNFETLFLSDDLFLTALRNTMIFALFTAPISYFLCLFFAWLINELPQKLRSLMTVIFYIPSISGNIYMIWQFIFSGDQYGMVNSLLMQLGIIQDPVQWLGDAKYALGVCILVQIWLSLGTAFLSFVAGFRGIDKTLYEAGAIEGIRNRLQELFYITLPSLGPQLLFGAVMQISSSFAVSAICVSLAGFPSVDYSAYTIVTMIKDYGTMRYEMGYASAISVVLFAMMLLMNGVIQKVLKRFTD